MLGWLDLRRVLFGSLASSGDGLRVLSKRGVRRLMGEVSLFLVFFFFGSWRAGLLQGGALGYNHRHKFVPGFDERSSPFVLESGGQGVEVDTGLAELSQDRFEITSIGRQHSVDFAVTGEGFQGGLRHCVNRQWCSQHFDIKNI